MRYKNDELDMMSQALRWARKDVEPKLSVTAMADLLGVKRTTLDSWERGTGKITVEVLETVGRLRNLPRAWWKHWDAKSVSTDARLPVYNARGTVRNQAGVLVPNVGYLTSSDLSSEPMIFTEKTLQVPAPMAVAGLYGGFAEKDDTHPRFNEGDQLFFLPLDQTPTTPPKIGNSVHVALPRGGCSVRKLVWDGDRMVCRLFREDDKQEPKPTDVAKSDCKVLGLLVGHISVWTDDQFSGEFSLSGL